MPAKCKRNSIHFKIITYHIHSCYQDSTLTPCGYNTEDARSSHMEPTHMQIGDPLYGYILNIAFTVQEDIKRFTLFTV